MLLTVRNLVRTIWAAGWPHGVAYPVIWHANENAQVPDPGAATHWLHLLVRFTDEMLAAYAGGSGANERDQLGVVEIRVFTAAAHGEDGTLDLLSDAMEVFRGRRMQGLSFVDDIDGVDGADAAVDDGNWWMRGAAAAFQYRFTG